MKNRMNGIILTSLTLLVGALWVCLGIFLEKIRDPGSIFPAEAIILAPLLLLPPAGFLVCLIISIIMLFRRRDAVYLLPLFIVTTWIASFFNDNKYFYAIRFHKSNLENYIWFASSYGIIIAVLYCIFVTVRLNNVKIIWLKVVLTLPAVFCLLFSELVLMMSIEILIVDHKFHDVMLIALIIFSLSCYILRKLWLRNYFSKKTNHNNGDSHNGENDESIIESYKFSIR